MKVISVSRALGVLVVGLVIGLHVEAQEKADSKLQVKVDPKMPDYKPVGGVSGNLKSIGSDTMNNLMALWGDGFHKIYPNVQIEIEGKGSTTAPPALIAGTAHFGPMSREMKSAEIDSFVKKFGYQPAKLATSIDM